MSTATPTTLIYATLPSGHELRLDVYVPNVKAPETGLPIWVSFHGGGLVSGNRNDVIFTPFVRDQMLSIGFLFVSVDTRLLVPQTTTATAFPQDIDLLFTYLASPPFTSKYPINVSRLATIGYSAGAHMARVAAIELQKPKLKRLGWKMKALVSDYGMGGDYFSDHWLFPWDGPSNGRKLMGITKKVDYETVKERFENGGDGVEFSDAPLVAGPTGLGVAGKGDLWNYLLESGRFLDVFTGSEELRKKLSGLKYEDREGAVPQELRGLFPQLMLNKDLPSTYIIHGGNDSVIPVESSKKSYEELKKLGVDTELVIVEEGEHGLLLPGKFAFVQEFDKIMSDMMDWVEARV